MGKQINQESKSQFDQQANRLDYGSLLLPEPGYEASFAVGMTYSLDLEALLSVPISLGMLEEMDDSIVNNPFALLEAIRKSSDKIAIFCNADGMSMPSQIRPVFALLENSVFCVHKDDISNFHPKLWIIQYTKKGAPDKVRVIVLSRNLTFDSSLDIAVEMTGDVCKEEKLINKPLADMLKFVQPFASDSKKKQIGKLIKAVMKVDEFDIGEQYESYRFVPVGIKGYKKSGYDLSKEAKKLLTVSPFLTGSLIEEITQNVEEKTLITREASVTRQIWDRFHGMGHKIYIMKDGMNNDDLLEESETAEEAEKIYELFDRDLHAKILYNSSNSGEYISMGSLNASHNAYENNVEFMVELKYKPGCSSYEDVTKEFVEGKYSAFEEMDGFDENLEYEENEEHASMLKDVVKALKEAEVTHTEYGYQVSISCEKLSRPAKIAPLFMTDRNNLSAMKDLEDGVVFEKLTVSQLSEFYLIGRDDSYCVVKLATNGIPEEERNDAIYNNVIGNREGFLAYLLFVLSDNCAEGISDYEELIKIFENAKENGGSLISFAIYEKLLKAAVQKSEKLDTIEEVMKKLDPDKVDDSLREMIQVFKKASEKKNSKKGRKR